MRGISTDVTFEVFDSREKWNFFIWKTLLEVFKAIHNYGNDEITLHGDNKKVIMINNQAYIINHSQPQIKPVSASPICEISEENQPERDEEYAEVNIEAIKNDTNLYTC